MMNRYSVATLLACLASAPAWTAPVVDQSYLFPVSDTFGAGVVGYSPTAGTRFTAFQTVTAGMTGQLTGLDLQISQDLVDKDLANNLEIAIVGNATVGASFQISGTLSAPISVALGDLPTFDQVGEDGALLSIDLSSLGISVTAGETFAIQARVSPSGGGEFDWEDFAGGLSNGYAGGSGYSFDGTRYLPTNDFGFRTVVDTNPRSAASVPEPAGWAMMAGGFGLLGGMLRRRRGSADFRAA